MKTELAKKELLQGVRFLDFLDPSDVNKLVHTMVPFVFERTDCIVQSGDKLEMDYLYVIQEGKVRITGAESKELGPGDHFGETAWLNRDDSKEPFTAVAITRVLLLCIDKETFEKVVGDIIALAIQAKDKQVLANIPIFKESRLSKPTFNALAALFVEKTYPPCFTIMTEGEETNATIYVVRSGKVALKSKRKGEERIVEIGGFFGEGILEMDAGCLKDTTVYNSEYTITTLNEPVVVGMLSIESCRNVFDTTTLGNVPLDSSKLQDVPISLDDLEKHTIIGAGTFGQVWLVSHLGSDGERHPYALKIQSKSELIESEQAKGVVQEKSNHGESESSVLGAPRCNVSRHEIHLYGIGFYPGWRTLQQNAFRHSRWNG